MPTDKDVVFFRHFYTENELIKTGKKEGVPMNLKTLGIGNGIIDAAVQFPMVDTPDFAQKTSDTDWFVSIPTSPSTTHMAYSHWTIRVRDKRDTACRHHRATNEPPSCHLHEVFLLDVQRMSRPDLSLPAIIYQQ